MTIGVSDDEMVTAAQNGFSHVPNYKNVELKTAGEGYVLSSAGDRLREEYGRRNC